MTRYVFVTLIAGVLLSCLSGCNRSNKPDGFPALYPCEITIKVNGVPLEGANVKLNSPDARWPPGGVTDVQGIAKINTYTHPGAPEGEYKVLVSKYEIPEALGKGTDVLVLQEGPPAKPLLQQKFGLPASTPLNCTVTKAGPNRFEFTVE